MSGKTCFKPFIFLILISTLIALPNIALARRIHITSAGFGGILDELGLNRYGYTENQDHTNSKLNALRYRENIIANINYLRNELRIPDNLLGQILIVNRNGLTFLTISLKTNQAKVDYLINELDVTPEDIGELLIAELLPELRLPSNGILSLQSEIPIMTTLDRGMDYTKSQIELLRRLGVSNDEMLDELRPIMNLNAEACRMIVDYCLESEVTVLEEGDEGCGDKIAAIYESAQIWLYTHYHKGISAMLSAGETEAIYRAIAITVK